MGTFKRHATIGALAALALSAGIAPAGAQEGEWVVKAVHERVYFVRDSEVRWELTEVRDRAYFLSDGQVTRKLSRTEPRSGERYLGAGARVPGAERILSRVPGEALLGEVPRSRAVYFEDDFAITYQLARYSLFEDVQGVTPWVQYKRYAMGSWSEQFFTLMWSDPLTHAPLETMDPVTTTTEPSLGTPYDKGVADSGEESFARRDSKGTEDRRVVLSKTYMPLPKTGAVAAPRHQGTFVSNRSAAGTAVTLSGSTLRQAIGANDAVASVAKSSKSGGTIGGSKPDLIDKVVGDWQLEGGSESRIRVERVGRSDRVTVDVRLKGVAFETTFTGSFAKTLTTSKAGQVLVLTFNDAGTELQLQLGSTRATFLKQ